MKNPSMSELGTVLALLVLSAGCGEAGPALPPAAASPAPAVAPAAVAAPAAPVAAVAPVAPAVVPAPAAAPVEGGPALDPATCTGTITVKAVAKGALPKMRPIKFDADEVCVGMHKDPVPEQTVVEKDGKLANVIAWVSKGSEKWSYTAPTDAVVIDQKGCQYSPHVLTLMVKQPLTIRNSDALTHNIHATPKVNEEFNHSQMKGSKDMTEKFVKEEIGFKIKCDIHNWMGAWAGVFSHPFHGVTGDDGTVKIKVPAGDYEISVWHEFAKFAKPAAQKVSVKAGETKELEFVFEAK